MVCEINISTASHNQTHKQSTISVLYGRKCIQHIGKFTSRAKTILLYTIEFGIHTLAYRVYLEVEKFSKEIACETD